MIFDRRMLALARRLAEWHGVGVVLARNGKLHSAGGQDFAADGADFEGGTLYIFGEPICLVTEGLVRIVTAASEISLLLLEPIPIDEIEL